MSINSSTLAKHFLSSALFSPTLSSSGYLYTGNLATGQSNEGTSILWIALEWVQVKAARVLPWNAPTKIFSGHWSNVHQIIIHTAIKLISIPWKARMERGGLPGGKLFMHEVSSSGVKSFPPRCCFRYQKKMALKAFCWKRQMTVLILTTFIYGQVTPIVWENPTSLEQEPQAIVVTCFNPLGATCSSDIDAISTLILTLEWVGHKNE